jgi:GrpB-like predicted nucleotidyltransferase (UPF0157 family)
MIELLPYDAAWSQAFELEAARFQSVFGDLFVDLQHIGSTAVPGLVAKPVIDILVAVPAVDVLDLHRDAWESLGYQVMGEFGIPGRRYFRKDDASGRRTHQVHAFAAGSSEFARHLDFRDYLRAHPASAEAYAALKRRLADECAGDMRCYSGGKTDFVRDIERRAAEWKREREGIWKPERK